MTDDETTDPIVGEWQFPNDNLMTFHTNGDVTLCDQRVAIWKRVEGRNYVVAYLRGHFGGASDPLEILSDGISMRGLANGSETRFIERTNEPNDPNSLVGDWDFKNGNLVTFTRDGWSDLCGARIGLWTRGSEGSFLLVYLQGYFGGSSDPLVLSDDGESLKGLIHGNWETQILGRGKKDTSTLVSQFDDAILRLGTIDLDVRLGPAGSSDASHVLFAEFPAPFPNERLGEVAVILTNRSAPTVVADATVARCEGRQGFWLRVSNCLPVTSKRDAVDATFEGTASFSWLAILSNEEPHELSNGRDYVVLSGLLEPQGLAKHSAHDWPHYPELFGGTFADCEMPLLFMTPTHGDGFDGPLGEHVSAVNRAVTHTRTGITELKTWNADSCPGYATFYWVAIARSQTGPVDSRDLAINCGVSQKPHHFARTATYNDWQNFHRRYKPPFAEPPHTFVTCSGCSVEGHHSTVIGLAFHQECESGNVKGRSCDPHAGQSGFHWIALGSLK